MKPLLPDLRLQKLAELLPLEEQVLELSRTVPFGAQLMVADPIRFLRDCGVDVDEGVVRELDEANPKWREAAKGYDDIKSGKAPECRYDVRLRRLGEVGKVIRHAR